MKLQYFEVLLSFFVGLSVVMATPLWAQPFFGDHQRGWFWYEPLPLAPEKSKKKPKSASEQMQALRHHIEEHLNQAILEPTEVNLKRYASVYFQALAKAQQFTDNYQVMLIHNPHLDYGLQFPLTPQGQAIYGENQQQQRKAALQSFAKTHGIFFFFKGDCAYCAAFAPVIKAFAKDYGIVVLPISLDGETLPEFPKAHANSHIVERFNIERVPALMAVDPNTEVVIPLAHGAISYSQLEHNIVRVLQHLERAAAPAEDPKHAFH